ncbi:MAG: DUF4469 domain-containing protein [Spirochaetaceae bacterium]|nr:DUF4469 domain-containing protein [Spirochaetaceae bacterium]
MNLGCYSVHPNVGGTFDKVTEELQLGKHPITFRFRTRAPLRALVAEHIDVGVEGLAAVAGHIDEFIDVSTEAVNETLVPGGIFTISGHKIKIAGDNPEVGVYFIPVAGPDQRIKVSGNLAENPSVKLIGVIPPELAAGTYRLEVVTQFSGGNNTLKEPWVIVFGSPLTVLAPGTH